MNDAVLRRASVGLGLAGAGIAGYLTYVHYAGLHPICGVSHGCETVQTSPYASLFGIPVALIGLITYVLILLILRLPEERGLLSGYVLTLIGFGFSVYLTYREVFTIHAICSWCVSSAIVFTLLAVLGSARVFSADRMSEPRPATSRAPAAT